MADEIVVSGLGDLILTSTLSKEIELLLADRASFRNNMALVDMGDVAGSNSTTRKQRYAGLDGYTEMAAVAEGAAVANTALADNSQTVAVGRQALQYEETDLAEMILEDGSVDPERLAASMVGSADMRFTSMICGVIDDFSQTAGLSGADFTFAYFQSGIYLLERAPCPTGILWSILAPIQVTDLQTDVTSLGGVVQYMAATQEMITAKGQGLIGKLLGVEIFKSQKVATSGSDRKGGIWHRGAVLFAEGTPKGKRIAANQVLKTGRIMVEFERNASSALTKVVGNYYVGTALSTPNDLLGVTFVSAAT